MAEIAKCVVQGGQEANPLDVYGSSARLAMLNTRPKSAISLVRFPSIPPGI